MPFSNVLVALDFSPASLAALRRAQALATRHGSIRLLHVVTAAPRVYGTVGTFTLLYKELATEARARLAELVARLRCQGFARVEADVIEGRPTEEILAACSRHRTDVVVVGAHARSTVGRLFLGSVSEELARRSTVPVLVVRERAEGLSAARILVAVDHDPPSRAAARAGAELARRLGVRLAAIHVVEWPGAPSFGNSMFGYSYAAAVDVTPEVLDKERCTIAQSLEDELGEGVDLHVVVGRPEGEILRLAQPDDIVVCGTHGRGALGRLAFGSVAIKLLRRAPCPVLVVRPVEGRPDLEDHAALAVASSARRVTPR